MAFKPQTDGNVWICGACTFSNDFVHHPTRCMMCNTSKDYIHQKQQSDEVIVSNYTKKYSEELLSLFYPFPDTRGCNTGDTAVHCILDDSLYLSGSFISRDMKWLKQNKIGAILNVAATDIKHTPSVYEKECDIILKQIAINDTSKDQYIMQKYIQESIVFIDECINVKNRKVLVHCAAGISRSSTVVIAYLMKYKKWDLVRSFQHVRNRRKYVYPNLGFWKLLIELNNEWIGNDNNNDTIQTSLNDEKQQKQTLLSNDILTVHAEELGKMTGTRYRSRARRKMKLL